MIKKKSGFLLTLGLLLASCGGGSSSLSSSEGSFSNESLSSSEVSSSIQTIKGDSSRTYLKNALETSLAKRGSEMTLTNASISSSTQEYEKTVFSGREDYFVKKGNKETVSINNGTIKAVSNNRNSSSFADLNAAFSILGADVTINDGAENKETKNQSGHLYLDDGTAYWDFLGSDGHRSEELFDASETLFTALLEILDYDVSSFTLSDKAKVTLDSDVTSLLDDLMPLSKNNDLLPSITDKFLAALDSRLGVNFVYSGTKDENGNKSYKTLLTVEDPKAIYDAIYSMVNDIPDIADTILGSDFSIQSILDMIEEFEPFVDSIKNFKFEIAMSYTMYSFTGLNFDIAFTSDASYIYANDVDDKYEVGDVVPAIESFELKGDASFIFDDERSITFPDFASYTEFTLPSKKDSIE
ncbi:MAG: hypothetical protein MJ228_03860 [Bacilli bacterium]|nr:hypothetical protein [Bacilli bacterium]